ncbi:unnamed protein product [Phyllotreta striolata]|uniref:Uncharacterized protein n=1 Tax=Phyllotreta striolata TaxID=444603 RepID=A0A9N9TGR1_PHYSR|nr:unnamed protein product [Phyllotreta striolata]
MEPVDATQKIPESLSSDKSEPTENVTDTSTKDAIPANEIEQNQASGDSVVNNDSEINNTTVETDNSEMNSQVVKFNEEKISDSNEQENKGDSSVILKNQTSSFRNILSNYQSDTSASEDSESDSSDNEQSNASSSSSSSDDEDENDTSRICQEISDDEINESNKRISKGGDKTSTQTIEQELFDPTEIVMDLSNLHIDYRKEEFIHIGHITHFISTIVTVETLKNTDSYDLKTVLFVDDGEDSKKAFGAICDVIGQVSQPVYCVRLKETKDIETLALEEGMKVYSAPKSVYTKYVFVKDLLRMKGTDASWIGDQEPPSDEMDSSEDEIEQESRKRTHNGGFNQARNRRNQRQAGGGNFSRSGPVQMFPHGFNPSVPPPNVPVLYPGFAANPQMPGYNSNTPQNSMNRNGWFHYRRN